MIKCIVYNTTNGRTENHDFMIDAYYKDEKMDVKAVLIDNQRKNKLTGIEDSDLKDKITMRRIRWKLYGGKKFDTIWLVKLKKNIVEK